MPRLGAGGRGAGSVRGAGAGLFGGVRASELWASALQGPRQPRARGGSLRKPRAAGRGHLSLSAAGLGATGAAAQLLRRLKQDACTSNTC